MTIAIMSTYFASMVTVFILVLCKCWENTKALYNIFQLCYFVCLLPFFILLLSFAAYNDKALKNMREATRRLVNSKINECGDEFT